MLGDLYCIIFFDEFNDDQYYYLSDGLCSILHIILWTSSSLSVYCLNLIITKIISTHYNSTWKVFNGLLCVVAVQDLLISDETSPYLIYLSCGSFHTYTP